MVKIICRAVLPTTALAAIILAAASPGQAAEIRVLVKDASATGGDIRAALCTRDEFPRLQCSRSVHAAVEGHRATLRFVAPPGRYSVAVFHDRYRDGLIHRSFIGIPRQGVGFSRNPLLFGSPSFARTAFDVGQTGASIVVHLRFEPSA